MCFLKIVFIQFLLALFIFKIQTQRTVVLVHGLLAHEGELQTLESYINKTHPGTNVQIIKVLYRGRSLIPMWDQVETYAEVFRSFVNQNPEGITLIGYSQGGLIARAIVESTPNHTVHTLIIIASPQMGMYGIPDEVYESYSFMKRFVTSIELLGRFAYSTIGQLISIGGYWKDPNYLDDYKTKSKFLPVLNNEISHSKEKEFKTNFLQLKRFVLLGSSSDEVIIPWQSCIFGFSNKKNEVIPMQEQEIYKKDTFGLKTLNEKGGVYTVLVPNINHHHWLNDFELYRNYIIGWLN